MCGTDVVEGVGHDLGVGIVKCSRGSDELRKRVAHLPDPWGLILLGLVPVWHLAAGGCVAVVGGGSWMGSSLGGLWEGGVGGGVHFCIGPWRCLLGAGGDWDGGAVIPLHPDSPGPIDMGMELFLDNCMLGGFCGGPSGWHVREDLHRGCG